MSTKIGAKKHSVSPSSTVTIQASMQSPTTPSAQEPQPILTLLTSQHPLIASTINNSLSAYTTSKSYSTPFRVGAEFVERNIAQPVANTVGTASRMTGVETGVRWWLNRGESGNQSGGSSKIETGSKRRRDSHEMDITDDNYIDRPPQAHRHRGLSEISQTETLPPYDDQRSPSYEEYATSQITSPTLPPAQASIQNSSWQTRFAIHTSGLGVAMSDESLRSLKYCLTWLRWSNGHLSGVLGNLQDVLGEWEQSQRQAQDDSAATSSNGRPPRDPAVITKHIQFLKSECVKVLKNAMDVVSKYAGGSLPENARWIVKSHLTSLPARFRVASQDQSDSASSSRSTYGGDEESQQPPEAVTGAQRVIILAKEGLEMIGQVTAVVDGTIISAEEWIEKLGRRRQPQSSIQADEILVEKPTDTTITTDEKRNETLPMDPEKAQPFPA